MSRLSISLALLLAAACGVKAMPRPPLEDDAPPPVATAPDGGCCRDRR